MGLIIPLVIVATGGINVIQHYCTHQSMLSQTSDYNNQLSALASESCCSLDATPDQESCCDQKETKSPVHSCNRNADCCFSVVTYLKTDQVNLMEEEYNSFKFCIAYEVRITEDFIATSDEVRNVLHTDDRHPPPKSGKKLLFEIQQLKIHLSAC